MNKIEILLKNPDFKDYLEAQRFHSRKTTLLLSITLFSFALFVFYITMSYLFLVFVASYIFVIRPWLFCKRLKKHWCISPIYKRNEYYYLFNETGIQTKDDENKLATTHWNNFIKFTESKNNFLLYLTPSLYYYITKRYLSSEDLKNLRNLLEEKIKKL